MPFVAFFIRLLYLLRINDHEQKVLRNYVILKFCCKTTFSAGESWGLLDASLRSEPRWLSLAYLKTYCPEEQREDGEREGFKKK